jgi:hypothetical protein
MSKLTFNLKKIIYQNSSDDSYSLKIKFEKINDVVELQEQIADDFAIKFSKYVEDLVIQDPQLYYESQTTELLQIFKSKYYEK